MKSVTFPISRVNRLRRAAERARELPDTDSDPFRPSWVVSASDPANLIGVFDTLQLRAGFALHAYEYRAGGNGNGIIWAVPAEAPLLAPEDCPRLDDVFLHPPKPPRAIALMEVIEGDGTPWSYLSASILWREAAEFGARWHGCMWSDQTILSAAPRQIDDPAALEDAWDELTADPPVGDWTWHRAGPSHMGADLCRERDYEEGRPARPESGRRRRGLSGRRHLSGGQLRLRDRDHDGVHRRTGDRLLTVPFTPASDVLPPPDLDAEHQFIAETVWPSAASPDPHLEAVPSRAVRPQVPKRRRAPPPDRRGGPQWASPGHGSPDSSSERSKCFRSASPASVAKVAHTS